MVQVSAIRYAQFLRQALRAFSWVFAGPKTQKAELQSLKIAIHSMFEFEHKGGVLVLNRTLLGLSLPIVVAGCFVVAFAQTPVPTRDIHQSAATAQ